MSEDERAPFMRDHARQRNIALVEKMRTETAMVIGLCAEAQQRVNTPREPLAQALGHLAVALAVAHQIDPEER